MRGLALYATQSSFIRSGLLLRSGAGSSRSRCDGIAQLDSLGREDYLLAQKLYLGWHFVAPVLILALASTILLLNQARAAGPAAEAAAIVACLCVGPTQVVFWIFTFSVNRATQNWTKAHPNWEALRRKWEYSHAAFAVLNLIAFAAAVLAALWPRRSPMVARLRCS